MRNVNLTPSKEVDHGLQFAAARHSRMHSGLHCCCSLARYDTPLHNAHTRMPTAECWDEQPHDRRCPSSIHRQGTTTWLSHPGAHGRARRI